MEYLKENDRIKLENGQEARVVKLLGEGAQGAVYIADVNGEMKALKWFRNNPDERFMQNLRKNISEGAPSPKFLWPEALSRPFAGRRGYLMPLKPEGSYEFSRFRMAKVRFSSFSAIIEAALQMCDAFRLLHAVGLSYQDLNDGGFFINPDTGDVRICDCDNVYPHGEVSGILGKARYMAPEIVAGTSLPNSYTDRFSLTVILFMLFCLDHPFEGLEVVRHPCLTEAIEKRMFGQDICFIFDPERKHNRPIRGVHHNSLTIWPLLPKMLQDAFIRQFGKQTLEHPQDRMTEMQWRDLFISVRDRLVHCPECGEETFLDDGKPCINPRCGKQVAVSLWLCGSGRTIPLLRNNQLRMEGDDKSTGLVIAKPGDPNCILIKNLSSSIWQVKTPSGKLRSVEPNGFMPARPGIKIADKFTIKDINN